MMMFAWLLPLVAGISDAGQRAAMKLTKTHRFSLVALGYLFALPYYAVWLAFEGAGAVKPQFWYIVVAHVPLWAFATVLLVEAHRSGAFTLTMPYMGLLPAFLLVTSPFMAPLTGTTGLATWWGVLGVVVVTVGVYVLNVRVASDGERTGLAEPFRRILTERAARLILGVVLIASITSNLDLAALRYASPAFYLLVDHTLLAFAVALTGFWYAASGRIKWRELAPQGAWWPLPLYGFLIAGSVVPHMLAFRWIQSVPYVIAGKRVGAILIAVAIGLALAFLPQFRNTHAGEREDLSFRLVGTAIVVVGMLLIIFLGINQ